MLEPVTPILPPGVADRYLELFVLAPFLSAIALHGLYWLIRSLNFYARNGWDFSQDFGPDMEDESGKKTGPVGKMFAHLIVAVSAAAFADLVLFKG